MIDSQVLAFAVAAAALTLAPGPDTMLVIRNVLRGGRRDGEAIAWLVVVSILSDRMRRVIVNAAFCRWADRVCGALLVGFGLRLAFERR